MTSPLDAAYYADRARQQRVTILENVSIARDTFRLRVRTPEIARAILPGQFVMLRLPDCDDPLIGRPFALYDTVDHDGQPEAVDIVYLVLGKMTQRLARMCTGQELDIWGPLGNGFSPQPTDHLVMVAGGIGQTPFLALAREHLGLRTYGDPARLAARVPRVSMCYGVRNASYLAGLEDFRAAGVQMHVSTDDGSTGRKGFVTELLEDVLSDMPARIVCCGPEPMMHAVAKIAAAQKVPCQVSLETPMACGIGICFSCVTRVRQQDGQWDYRRTCVEGPVFDAEQIEW